MTIQTLWAGVKQTDYVLVALQVECCWNTQYSIFTFGDDESAD